MSHPNRLSFRMMSFVHETLYGLFRDPYKALKAAGLEPGQKVLEVGCGPGHFTIPAAEIVGDKGSVLALDVNPLAVAHFIVGFVRPIGGTEAIWAEMHRLLKSDGTLAVEGRLQPPEEIFRPAKRQGRIGQFNK
jgi:D-arabinose 1-dehydrogenase-like Zn-dependent alcohol dehydrogenase